jgi:hypothetical protein
MPAILAWPQNDLRQIASMLLYVNLLGWGKKCLILEFFTFGIVVLILIA